MPDDLLVDERTVFFPGLLNHQLTTAGVPAIPGSMRLDRVFDGDLDEAIVEVLVSLKIGLVPCRAVGFRPVGIGFRAGSGIIGAVVPDQIRRVGGEEDGAFAVHKALHVLGVLVGVAGIFDELVDIDQLGVGAVNGNGRRIAHAVASGVNGRSGENGPFGRYKALPVKIQHSAVFLSK